MRAAFPPSSLSVKEIENGVPADIDTGSNFKSARVKSSDPIVTPSALLVSSEEDVDVVSHPARTPMSATPIDRMRSRLGKRGTAVPSDLITVGFFLTER
jgi:hypothetical protein